MLINWQSLTQSNEISVHFHPLIQGQVVNVKGLGGKPRLPSPLQHLASPDGYEGAQKTKYMILLGLPWISSPRDVPEKSPKVSRWDSK